MRELCSKLHFASARLIMKSKPISRELAPRFSSRHIASCTASQSAKYQFDHIHVSGPSTHRRRSGPAEIGINVSASSSSSREMVLSMASAILRPLDGQAGANSTATKTLQAIITHDATKIRLPKPGRKYQHQRHRK